MPVIRLHVKTAHIPTLSSHVGSNLAVRSRSDSDYIITDAYTGTAANEEIGISQIAYAHNVLPANFGVKSVGYEQRVKEHKFGLEIDFSEVGFGHFERWRKRLCGGCNGVDLRNCRRQ